jgi:hypothetical protein
MYKRILILLLFSQVLFWGGCSGKQSGNTLAKQAVIDRTDSCQLSPQHTYQIFIPAVDKSCTNWPVMILIDPHGDGKYAIDQFKEAAKKYPVILVASNLIKNNYSGYIQSIDELIADVKSKYPVGNTIYISGFSGGARMAIDYATNHRVNGIIACGALAQHEQITAVRCPLMAIVGLDDFNFIEAAQYVVDPLSIPQNLLIELTNASHSWPEKGLLTRAMGYLQLSSGESNTCFSTKSLVKAYVAEQKSCIDSFIRSKEALKAAMVARNMAISKTFEKSSSFQPIYAKLIEGNECIQQQEKLSVSLRFENEVRQAYFKALHQKDSLWWRNEITSLNSKIESEPNLYSQMAFRRIKGFLGIVCYSLSNQYVAGKDTEKLEQILAVYRMVEPNNADMLNFSAALEKMKGSTKRK